MKNKEITQEFLKEIINYCPDSGVFTWKHRDETNFSTHNAYKAWNSRFSGKMCGTISTKGNGYRRIKISINNKQYMAHRLAWIYMKGELPPNEIDHIDRDATNNKWSNIREGSNNQRNKSKQRNNTSGVTGVSWSKVSNKWGARVWALIDGERKYVHLGLFNCLEEAEKTVENFRSKHNYSEQHGENFANYITDI